MTEQKITELSSIEERVDLEILRTTYNVFRMFGNKPGNFIYKQEFSPSELFATNILKRAGYVAESENSYMLTDQGAKRYDEYVGNRERVQSGEARKFLCAIIYLANE